MPTRTVSKRRSVTQTTPWPPDSQNLKTRSIRHCTLYTNRSGKVGARTRTNGQDQPNRHPTQPQQLRSKTQKPRRASGRQSRRQSTNKNERTNMQSNPNRGPAQPQQLRSKTQKPRRARGKPSRRQSTNKNERTSKATQTEAQLNHSSSGQRPKSHGEQAGINPGRNERGVLSSPVAAAVTSTRVKV